MFQQITIRITNKYQVFIRKKYEYYGRNFQCRVKAFFRTVMKGVRDVKYLLF